MKFVVERIPVGRKPKISEISEIRGLLKIIVVYKEVEAYEEQGILEDGDTDCHFGADGTDDYAGSNQLHGQRPDVLTLTGHPNQEKWVSR